MNEVLIYNYYFYLFAILCWSISTEISMEALVLLPISCLIVTAVIVDTIMYYYWGNKNTFKRVLLCFIRSITTYIDYLTYGFTLPSIRLYQAQNIFLLLGAVAPNSTSSEKQDTFYITRSLQYQLKMLKYRTNNFVDTLRSLLNLTTGFSFTYLLSFSFILFIDACLSDDEPLWEPIEWSMVQSWILFIFLFGWIAENLITSRYGSYVGRDKRVWMGWFKTFWLIEMFYVANLLIAAAFVIVPFYFEINYSVAFVYSWWNWISRTFLCKISMLLTILLLLAYIAQTYIQSLYWRKLLFIITLINICLSYLIYTHFIMSFFGYLTDANWYYNSRNIDYVQLSHEPSKWAWNYAKKRAILPYHSSRTVVWFKNDGPIASALLLFNLYMFISIFFVYIYWISLFRRVYSTREVPTTYMTYCTASLKQLFYGFLWLYSLVLLSFIFQYWRLPTEFVPILNYQSWFVNFVSILPDYPNFVLSIFEV